jgi:hypothetical protein
LELVATAEKAITDGKKEAFQAAQEILKKIDCKF